MSNPPPPDSGFSPDLLLDLLSDIGPVQVGERLGRAVEATIRTDSPDLDSWLAQVLGPRPIAQIEKSRQAVLNDATLRKGLGDQLGRLVSQVFRSHALAKLLPVTFLNGKTIGFQDHGEARSLPLAEISRFMDWGWVPVSDGEDRLRLQAQVAWHLQRTVERLLGSMRRIVGSQAYADLGAELDVAGWIELGGGSSLELFFRDCLLLEGLPCSRAPLHEDILEATDLRVKVPDLERNNGVRIQVSWISEYDAFVRKRHLIPHGATVVFLSPFTLVQEWQWREGQAIPVGYPNSVQRKKDEAAAATLKARLTSVLRHQTTHPLGPAEAAPQDLVRLIAEFTEFEARRCHQLMRTIQRDKPAYGSRATAVRDRLIAELRSTHNPPIET